MVDGDHVHDVFVCIYIILQNLIHIFCLANGCLEPLPDTIENGWKSGETYVIQNDMKYYLLTRYSCHENAVINGTSLKVIDIQCRNSQWQYESLPVCQLPE